MILLMNVILIIIIFVRRITELILQGVINGIIEMPALNLSIKNKY